MFLGNATFTGVASTPTIDLSKSTITVQKLLNASGVELVSNLGAPVTLTRQPGALPGLATFVKTGLPTITMQVVTLPLIGQTVTIQVTGANVNYPSTCPFGLGAASLTTQFTISGGTASPVLIQGTDGWVCVPGQMLSL